MPDPIEDFAYAVGDAIVAPGLGSAELLLAIVVAGAFIASAGSDRSSGAAAALPGPR